MTIKERVLKKTRKFGSCIIWTGCIGYKGAYGTIRYNKKLYTVHRLMWTDHHGREPEARLYNQCGSTLCVNPEHWLEIHSGNREKVSTDKYRERRLKSRYGITNAQRLRMIDRQGGVCACCKRPETEGNLCVDHCHKTKRVRGMLCADCNKALGLLKDDPKTARAMARYLSR